MDVNMPKVTPVMLIALLTWITSQAVAFGWIDKTPDQELLSATATLLAVGISLAEAHLRGKRVIAHATVLAAASTNRSSTDVTVPPK